MHRAAVRQAPRVSLKSILLATDLSPSSEKPLFHAAAIARHYGSKLYLVHVVSSLGFTLVGPESLAFATDAAVRDLRAVERKLMISGAVAGVDHEAIVCDGDVWEDIERITRQKQVDLIVVGTHSRAGIARLVLGSTAEQIFRLASCPVLTVGPYCSRSVRLASNELPSPVLFPTDFTKESLIALPYAASFANEQNTRLVLLHMLPPLPEAHGDRWYTATDIQRMKMWARDQALEQLRTLVRHTDLVFEPICMADFGAPAEGILWAASTLKTKTVVMGLRRKGHVEIQSHLPWSTAYTVVCGSSCPVLTVRA